MKLTTIKDDILASEHFDSVRENPRLQWMLLFILVLVCIYIGKISVDTLQENKATLAQQAQLFARLQATYEADIKEEDLVKWQTAYEQATENIPKAKSSSLAEASALAQLENTLSPLLSRARLNLLGAEEKVVSDTTFYSVRVELSGQLATQNLSEFLKRLEQNREAVLLHTINYSPRASNTISVVVDVIFLNNAVQSEAE